MKESVRQIEINIVPYRTRQSKDQNLGFYIPSQTSCSSSMNRRSNSTLIHTGYWQHGDAPYDDDRINVSSISLVPGSSMGVVGRMGSFGSVQEGACVIPFALARFTSQHPTQNLARNTNMPRGTLPRRLLTSQSSMAVDPMLMENEHNKGLEKLRREIYNPGVERVSLYYRDHNSRSKSREKNNNEDGKKCVICLDDFEPREMVTVTPCHHMFHENCIVTWIKNQGQCPVCRFVISDESKDRKGTRTHNNIELGNDPFARELVSFIRTMEARV